MNNRLTAFSQKQPFFWFLIKFILLFSTEYLLFRAYVGLVDPEGDHYWPILSQLDLIQGMRYAIKYPLSLILQFLGFSTAFSVHGIVMSKDFFSGGIVIQYACLGIEVMLVYIALIVSYPGRKKILFLLSGLLLIHLLNIGRMMGILLLMTEYMVEKVQIAHDVFNLIAYSSVLAIFYLYIRVSDKAKGKS